MIIRVERRSQFVIVDQATIDDVRLSWKARGLLVWFLGRPPGWRINSKEIAEYAPDGRDAVRAGLAELDRYGYLRREKVQNEHGQWVTETVIYECPVEPRPDIPAPEKPTSAHPAPDNAALLSGGKVKTESQALPEEPGRARRPSEQQKIAQDLVEAKVVPILRDSAGFDTFTEFSKAFNEGWFRCVDDGLNPTQYGVEMMGLFSKLIGVEPKAKDFSMFGRLIGQFGVYALYGFKEAMNRDLEGDWMPYAVTVAKARQIEARVKAQAEGKEAS